MNSAQIAADIEVWATNGNFSAPYGVLSGIHTSKSGTKYHSVTFGRARTLDATVEVYNRRFMILRTSRWGSQTFTDYDSLKAVLHTL